MISGIPIRALDIGIMLRVFVNGPGDLGSIPGQVIPKTQKMLLDTTMLNTHLLGKDQGESGAIQGKEKRPPLDVVAIEKGAFGSLSTSHQQLFLSKKSTF